MRLRSGKVLRKKSKSPSAKETKTNKRKTPTKKKQTLDGSIEESDILYQDDLVCILRPNVKKGILIWTSYDQPKDSDSLCTLGLKTGKQLQKEGVNFGRSIFHPYIFFRAPYVYSSKIDYSTLETEIFSSYGDDMKMNSKVFIRVDPDKTYTFSSEIRIHKYNDPYALQTSKKSLSEYLKIINENTELEKIQYQSPGKELLYNLQTSEAVFFPATQNFLPSYSRSRVKSAARQKRRYSYPYDDKSINRYSEILVSVPHLTSEYFVLCTK
jgi:hypothetical protein